MHRIRHDSVTGFYGLRALLVWFVVGTNEKKKCYFLAFSNILNFVVFFDIFANFFLR